MANAKDMSGDYFFDKISRLLNENVSQDEIAKIFTEDFNKALCSYEKEKEQRRKNNEINRAAQDLANTWNNLLALVLEDEDIDPDSVCTLTGEQALETVRRTIAASRELDRLSNMTKNGDLDQFLEKIQKWLKD
jgi:cation transport regulator ChaB